MANLITASPLSGTLAEIGRRVFPQRIWIGLLFAGGAALFVRSHDRFVQENHVLLAASLVLIAGGLGMRAWGSGCAGRHTRSPTIEAPQLVTGGPFALVRHPIYLGTMLLGLGMVGVLGERVLLVFYLAACVALYATMIPAEEAHLRQLFGAAYDAYGARVPRFFPKLTSWETLRAGSFSWRAAAGEWRIAAVLVLIYAAFRVLAR